MGVTRSFTTELLESTLKFHSQDGFRINFVDNRSRHRSCM